MDLDFDRRNIKRIVEARGIKKLCHFTRYGNLQSILTHGLLNRTFLEENDEGIDAFGSDDMRLDKFPNTISTSIESINRSMLAQKMKDDRNIWAIISLDADILWKQKCRFCWTNAASKEVSRYRYLNSAEHFEGMFEDREFLGGSWREHHGIPDNRPTWRDAEVMVFDYIDLEKILSITVQNHDRKRHLEKNMARHDQMRTVEVNVSPQDF